MSMKCKPLYSAMKFFSEFRLCYGSAAAAAAAQDKTSSDADDARQPLRPRRRGRRMYGSSGSEQWRPELSVISEDAVVSAPAAAAAATGEKSAAKMRALKLKNKEYGKSRNFSSAVVMATPAFLPAPFTF